MRVKEMILLFALFFSSCEENNKYGNENETVILIRLKDEKTFNMDTFADEHISEIRYVPLETNDESLIAEIEKVYLYKELIIIFDQRANRILLFDMDGKYIRKIGRKGGGPNEYFSLNDIFFEESSGLIYAHERSKNVIFVYDLEGQIIETIQPSFHFNSFCKSKDGFWIYSCFQDNNPNGYNLMLVDNSMQKMIGGYFPQHPNFINKTWATRFRLDSEGVNYFAYPTSNCVYKLADSVPEIVYRVDFVNRNAPFEMIAEIESSEEYEKLIENEYLLMGNYNIWNETLIFNFSESAYNKPHTLYTCFYHKNSTLHIAGGFDHAIKVPSSTIISVSGQALILYIWPYHLWIEEQREYMEKQIGEKLDEEANPILIICYPKVET